MNDRACTKILFSSQFEGPFLDALVFTHLFISVTLSTTE